MGDGVVSTEVELLREFAHEVLRHFDFEDTWHQCPWCLWTGASYDPIHDRCWLVDVAALLGLEPKGSVGEAVAEVLA